MDDYEDVEPLKLLTSSSIKKQKSSSSKKQPKLSKNMSTPNPEPKKVDQEVLKNEEPILEKVPLAKSQSTKVDRLSSANAYLSALNRDLYKAISELQIEQMT